MRFIAIAKVSWASEEIDPYDMAPVENRLMIEAADSTSSSGTAGLNPARIVKSPRNVISRSDWSFTPAVYCRKISNRLLRVAC